MKINFYLTNNFLSTQKLFNTDLIDYFSNWELNENNQDDFRNVYNFENNFLKLINETNKEKFPKTINKEKYHRKITNWKTWALENSSQQNQHSLVIPIDFKHDLLKLHNTIIIKSTPIKEFIEFVLYKNFNFNPKQITINYQDFIEFNKQNQSNFPIQTIDAEDYSQFINNYSEVESWFENV